LKSDPNTNKEKEIAIVIQAKFKLPRVAVESSGALYSGEVPHTK
jgi:hypothetical protein